MLAGERRHADHRLALKAVEGGAWEFLAKPVDPDLLRVVVARALNGQGSCVKSPPPISPLRSATRRRWPAAVRPATRKALRGSGCP